MFDLYQYNLDHKNIETLFKEQLQVHNSQPSYLIMILSIYTMIHNYIFHKQLILYVQSTKNV
jgi:DNA phosphorothioation-dependent restriction protein DptG